jgi:hypothetical protein
MVPQLVFLFLCLLSHVSLLRLALFNLLLHARHVCLILALQLLKLVVLHFLQVRVVVVDVFENLSLVLFLQRLVSLVRIPFKTLANAQLSLQYLDLLPVLQLVALIALGTPDDLQLLLLVSIPLFLNFFL